MWTGHSRAPGHLSMGPREGDPGTTGTMGGNACCQTSQAAQSLCSGSSPLGLGGGHWRTDCPAHGWPEILEAVSRQGSPWSHTSGHTASSGVLFWGVSICPWPEPTPPSWDGLPHGGLVCWCPGGSAARLLLHLLLSSHLTAPAPPPAWLPCSIWGQPCPLRPSPLTAQGFLSWGAQGHYQSTVQHAGHGVTPRQDRHRADQGWGCVPGEACCFSCQAEGDPSLGTGVLVLPGLGSAQHLGLSFRMHTLEVRLMVVAAS